MFRSAGGWLQDPAGPTVALSRRLRRRAMLDRSRALSRSEIEQLLTHDDVRLRERASNAGLNLPRSTVAFG